MSDRQPCPVCGTSDPHLIKICLLHDILPRCLCNSKKEKERADNLESPRS